HVGHCEAFRNGPEMAGVPVLQLHLDRERKHRVEGARLRSVYQHTGVAGLCWEAVFDVEPVVAVARIRDEMPAGLTQAHEHSIAHEERTAEPRVGVGGRDVDVPAREVLTIEEAAWLALRRAARRPAECRGRRA